MAAGKENLTPVLCPRKIQTRELKKTDKDEQNEQFRDIENLSAKEILKRIKGCYYRLNVRTLLIYFRRETAQNATNLPSFFLF